MKYISKLSGILFTTLLITGVVLMAAVRVLPVNGIQAADTLNGDEIILDPDCSRYILFATDAFTGDPPVPVCNTTCKRSILYDAPDYQHKNGNYCEYNQPTVQGTGTLGDSGQFISPAPEDAAMIYIRAALYALVGATSLLVILYGLYGWYKYAMSEGNPEKVTEAQKTLKNAVIGTVIIILSFSLVQLIFTLLGVTDSVFEFTFIPKAGFKVEVLESDVGRFCYSEQKDKSDKGGTHTCVENKWQ